MTSFDDAVRANAADLLNYLERRVDVRADAADALGDALLAAWRRRASLPSDPEQARMWLFGIARNTLLNSKRTTARRGAVVQRLRDHLEHHQREPASPEENVEVREAITLLDAEKAELVRLIHWDGFSIVEAALIVGVPASTARSRYAAAREQLRRTLTPENATDEPPSRTETTAPQVG